MNDHRISANCRVRSLISASALAGIVLGIVGCAQAGDDGTVSLRIAHTQGEQHPYQTCGVSTLETELAASDVGLSIEVFPNAQLGSNEDNLEALQSGELDGAIPGVGSLSIFDSRVGVLELAFAYDSLDDVQRVVDGPIGEEIILPLRESANARMLGPLWPLGTRHVTSNAPVKTPEDLRGMTLRSQDTPSSRATVQALGAQAVPINFTELYLALSQGVVDGQENPLNQIDFGKFQETQDFLSMTGHVQNASALLIAERTYAALTPEQQEALEAAADAAHEAVAACIAELDADLLAVWQENEVIQIVEPDEIDIAAFRAHAREVYNRPEYAEIGGSFFDEVARD